MPNRPEQAIRKSRVGGLCGGLFLLVLEDSVIDNGCLSGQTNSIQIDDFAIADKQLYLDSRTTHRRTIKSLCIGVGRTTLRVERFAWSIDLHARVGSFLPARAIFLILPVNIDLPASSEFEAPATKDQWSSLAFQVHEDGPNLLKVSPVGEWDGIDISSSERRLLNCARPFPIRLKFFRPIRRPGAMITTPDRCERDPATGETRKYNQPNRTTPSLCFHRCLLMPEPPPLSPLSTVLDADRSGEFRKNIPRFHIIFHGLAFQEHSGAWSAGKSESNVSLGKERVSRRPTLRQYRH